MLVICVLAEAPVASVCKPELATHFGEAFTARLVGAMLRDTLDGLLSVPAGRYACVYCAANESTRAQAKTALENHVHAPWEIVPSEGVTVGDQLGRFMREQLAPGDALLVATPDAPTAEVGALITAAARLFEPGGAALLMPSQSGLPHVFATTAPRADVLEGLAWSDEDVLSSLHAMFRRDALPVHELDATYAVRTHLDFERLVTEVKAHPERAPKCADFFVRTGW